MKHLYLAIPVILFPVFVPFLAGAPHSEISQPFPFPEYTTTLTARNILTKQSEVPKAPKNILIAPEIIKAIRESLEECGAAGECKGK